MLFKRNAPSSVRLGESFVKTGDPAGSTWTVTRLWTTAVGIPHAEIENSGQSRIISVSALTDQNFFGPRSKTA
ncbi:MAG: hypothetical protein ACM31L_12590 [Actinomycetota bacterium]